MRGEIGKADHLFIMLDSSSRRGLFIHIAINFWTILLMCKKRGQKRLFDKISILPFLNVNVNDIAHFCLALNSEQKRNPCYW
jgi:hypothetical protein